MKICRSKPSSQSQIFIPRKRHSRSLYIIPLFFVSLRPLYSILEMTGKISNLFRTIFSKQFIRFVLVAALNTAFGLFVNYVFLYVFQNLLKINQAYIISNFLATVVSILFNFKTYGALVFKNKDNKLILRFLLATTFTYLCNVGGIYLLEHTICQNNYVNITVMAIPVGLLNYFLYSTFVFKKNSKIKCEDTPENGSDDDVNTENEL